MPEPKQTFAVDDDDATERIVLLLGSAQIDLERTQHALQAERYRADQLSLDVGRLTAKVMELERALDAVGGGR
jgi:hypothetical protein